MKMLKTVFIMAIVAMLVGESIQHMGNDQGGAAGYLGGGFGFGINTNGNAGGQSGQGGQGGEGGQGGQGGEGGQGGQGGGRNGQGDGWGYGK